MPLEGFLLTKSHFCRLIFTDELDYLITRDRAVLHDLFMLTTFPFSRCILIGTICGKYLIDMSRSFLYSLFLKLHATFAHDIFAFTGIANAIDLADRFLPRLQSLNCKLILYFIMFYLNKHVLFLGLCFGQDLSPRSSS